MQPLMRGLICAKSGQKASFALTRLPSPYGSPLARSAGRGFRAASSESAENLGRRNRPGFAPAVPVLVLDDWGLIALSTQDRADLLEILDDRLNARSTIICSQLPVGTWHSYLGEPTLADAILDRIVHHSHRIELKTQGESLLESLPPPTAPLPPDRKRRS
jgi:hypothetical protein